MLRTLNGVVSGVLLLVMLGIGTTPAGAATASPQKEIIKPGQSVLCEKAGILCSIGNVSAKDLKSKKLVVDNSSASSSQKLASPVKQLDTLVDAAPVKNTDICSIYSAPEVEEVEPEALVSSVSYYATPTVSLDQQFAATQPAATEIPTMTVTPTPAVATAHQLDAEKLFSLVNQKRTEAGLAPLQKNGAVCEVAQARAPEMQSNVMSGNMHAGFYARKPDYQSTENIIYMQTEEQALNWWLNSPVHRSAIYGSYADSCLVCEGNTCAQIFANVSPVAPTPTPAIQ